MCVALGWFACLLDLCWFVLLCCVVVRFALSCSVLFV